MPSACATTLARADPCGSSGAIAFSTLTRNGPTLIRRFARKASQSLTMILLRYGSALTNRRSPVPAGSTISSKSLPNATFTPKNAASSGAMVGRTCIIETRSGTSCCPVA